MPTIDELEQLVKSKEDMPNLALAGFHLTEGEFFDFRGYDTSFWSSSVNGSRGWGLTLYLRHSDVFRYSWSNDFMFSVRCLKD